MFNKEMFISGKIADKNSEIMNAYFTLNKKLDNLMDYVDINCIMPLFSQGLHKIAHRAPIDADRFRDYNALYSFRTKYTSIEGQYKDFSNPLEGIDDILDYLCDMDNMLAEAKLIAKTEENYDYERFLNKEIVHLRDYKKQFVLLHDKLEQYLKEGNTLQDYDFRADKYFDMPLSVEE